MVRAFANGPRDEGSIQDRVIPKTQKMPFQRYKVGIKGKRSNPIISWCRNYYLYIDIHI